MSFFFISLLLPEGCVEDNATQCKHFIPPLTLTFSSVLWRFNQAVHTARLPYIIQSWYWLLVCDMAVFLLWVKYLLVRLDYWTKLQRLALRAFFIQPLWVAYFLWKTLDWQQSVVGCYYPPERVLWVAITAIVSLVWLNFISPFCFSLLLFS